MNEFRKNILRTNKLERFLSELGFTMQGCGLDGNHLIYVTSELKNNSHSVWHVGSVSDEYIHSIDLDSEINKSDFEFIGGFSRENKETPRDEFIEIVKKYGKVRAGLSHSQTHPVEIHFSAILDWQYDGKLFTVTTCGKRAECSDKMPAFHLYK